jgi:hypothetical protein
VAVAKGTERFKSPASTIGACKFTNCLSRKEKEEEKEKNKEKISPASTIGDCKLQVVKIVGTRLSIPSILLSPPLSNLLSPFSALIFNYPCHS